MEFACGFVYVPPVQKRSNPKRSALLPPVNRVRPKCPPPPPPTAPTEVKQEVPSSPKFIEQVTANEVKKVTKGTSVFYGNDSVLNKTSVPIDTPPQQTPPKKTALLPPHMRPAATSRPLSYSEPWCANPDYEQPPSEPNLNAQPWDPIYSYDIPEGSGDELKLPARPSPTQPSEASVPTLPPRPAFMQSMAEYLVLLPSSSSPSSTKSTPQPAQTTTKSSVDNGRLPGNPNVVLVSLGKLLSEENVQSIQGEPLFCSVCNAVLDSIYSNVVCYFCQCRPMNIPVSIPQCPLDVLFSLSPEPEQATDPVLLFCIDTSGSMSITSQVTEEGEVVYRSRLEFVQKAVLHCVQILSEQQPNTRVGLVTFNYKVTLHGYETHTTQYLGTDELIDTEYLKEAADTFPSPPPVSKNKDYLQKQVMGLKESGTTALGPAALLTIAMASKHPGSKVIICTDGKANTELGNLEEEDIDARTLLSSTIFYQDLGEYAANTGVTVSVLSIEGTDCRLDELGTLADRTGGKVVIASPNRLHQQFEKIIEDRTIATHCTVSFLLPKSLRVKGERDAGHKGIREVGNVDLQKEITFQYGANEPGAEVPAPASGNTVYHQLQIRYTQRNGQRMLRVITAQRDVTNDSSAVLSSLSLAIVQLNSSQATAALAVRGRFLDAMREGEQQKMLIERAIAHYCSAEDKQMYQEWVKTMDPIHNNIHNFRRKSVISDSQSLTDAGAVLLYTMKHSNRKSISVKDKHKL